MFNFRMPYSHRMPKFKHICKPCDDCGSSGDPDCLTCEGQSTDCDCEAAYDQECNRRYGLWKDEG